MIGLGSLARHDPDAYARIEDWPAPERADYEAWSRSLEDQVKPPEPEDPGEVQVSVWFEDDEAVIGFVPPAA
jgi:hypothetical protein